MLPKKLGSIAFILDERLPREKSQMLMRTVNMLRQTTNLTLLSGGSTEEEIVKQLQETTFDLVVVPWYRYLAWKRVEAFYGMTRTSGPTFVGYFADQLLPYELGEQSDHYRAILLDFNALSTREIILFLRALMKDQTRSGIRPLLEAGTSIYCETWYGGQGLGARIDTVSALPEIQSSDWSKRLAAIRICLGAYWSLVYEEGPGKGELVQATTARSPKAYFQLAMDKSVLLLRLVYSMSSWSPKDALSSFWPDSKSLTPPAQLLFRYSDFLRVHTVADTSDVEIVVGFFHHAPSEKGQPQMRTFWIEPIAAHTFTEIPFEAPTAETPHLKLLPGAQAPEAKPASAPSAEDTAAKERFIVNAALQIRELKKTIQEKDETIRELKSGGIGTSQPLPPPDAESLLEAFQERFFESQFQIRQLELAIVEAEKKGSSPRELEGIQHKISALITREQGWLRKIASTVEIIRETKKKASGAGG